MQDFLPLRFIVGAGRHAEETFYLLEDLGETQHLGGFVVDAPGVTTSFLGRPVWSMPQFLKEHALINTKPEVLVAIGNIEANKKCCATLIKAGFSFFNAIAAGVPLQRQHSIGKGVTIAAGTVLTTNISIGNFSIINIGCTISHDVVIGQNVNISPGVHIAGNVHIADEVFIGIAASIIPRIAIGKGSIIAAGACVTQDVPPLCMVAGVPAQIKKRFSSPE